MQQEQTRASRRGWSYWRVTVAAVVAIVLVVSQLASYKPHFDTHLAKHRILRNLQERPALRLKFQLKRSSMNVHGVSAFDVLATPSPAKSLVGFNGQAMFQEGGATHEYSLVDGTAYYTHRPGGRDDEGESGCMPSSLLPPIENLMSAIDTATTATHLVEERVVQALCPTGALLAFTFAGDDLLLCSQQSGFASLQDSGFKIFGSDLNIDVSYEQFAPVIEAPSIPAGAALKCGKVRSSKFAAPSAMSLFARSFSEWGHRTLRSEAADFSFEEVVQTIVGDDDSSCSCSGAQRSCVFIAGLSSHDDYGLTDYDPEEYFGSEIQDHAPCCSSIQYITLATHENNWYDVAFQQRLVDLLLQVSGTSDATTRTVKDTIVVAHSMANNILSGAIANSLCTLDPSSTWVAASAPMEGSMGSNYLQEACDGTLTDIVQGVVDLFDGCPPSTGRISLAYQGTNYSTAEMNGAYAAAQTAYVANVDAVMCSNGYSGLVSAMEAMYALAGGVVPHKSSENDGIVEYQSCAAGLSMDLFSNSYDSTYYLTELNHVDTTFRYGDGLFSDTKKPMKWFECLL
ncbi:hypothetical protein BBJ28_00006834 [Nothophytophthora sp. Chile5]|nr:hypothetical protein BBJ28_00006834 [Nothophytophthora sp. Chile5]